MIVDDGQEHAGPEKELDDESGKEYEFENDEERRDLDGEQDESDSGLGWDESWPLVEPADVPSPPEERPSITAYGSEPTPGDDEEPVILGMPAVESEDDFEVPELTPEILLKMFANMQANGMWYAG